MGSKQKRTRPEPKRVKLNKVRELRFWRSIYRVALPVLLLKRNGKRLPAAGLAHLAADQADAAVIEYRRRTGSAR